MGGHVLPLWAIFKAKMQQQIWKDTLIDRNAKVCLSENGWTNNELGLKWFEEHFQPLTEKTSGVSGWRILIYDGHASHVTTGVIQFCIQHNIALLFLMPHPTQFLKPMDF